MKTISKSIIAGFIIALIFSFLPFERQCRAISDEVLRIHILADSNSNYDQNLKLKVRDAVLEYTDSLFDSAECKEDAINISLNHLEEIKDVAQKTLRKYGCEKSVSAEITEMNFNVRQYEDITMPSGEYTALRLKIGSGEGKNWWCVMYPSLCLYTSADIATLEDSLTYDQYEVVSDSEKYEFRFKLLEYFDYFCDLFR